MAKYSCPVCDRVMKGQHYCSFCRQYVKNPYVSKVNYYLNERHPAFEADCEYHGKAAPHEPGQIEKAMEKVRIAAETAFGEAPGSAQRQLNRNVKLRNKTVSSGGQSYIPQARRNQDSNTKKTSAGTNNVIAAIFIIIAVINIMGSCIANY